MKDKKFTCLTAITATGYVFFSLRVINFYLVEFYQFVKCLVSSIHNI